MGISLDSSNAFTITNVLGETKFSLDRQMPHLIQDYTGYVLVPKVFKDGVDLNSQIVNRTDTLVTLVNDNDNTDKTLSVDPNDAFIFPWFYISQGYADTSTSNVVVSGTGSTIVRKLVQSTDKSYLGSSIIDVVQENSELKIVCRQSFNSLGFANHTGDVSVGLYYRVYYGRFK